MASPSFHLSIPAWDLTLTRQWYEQVLGCVAGRSSAAALILDLGGHQLVAQQQPHGPDPEPVQQGIYPRHFGLQFDSLPQWQALRERVEAAGEPFAVAPKCRYPGSALEHHTFFLNDPSGNWLEFKHYSHPEAVLGCREQAEVGDPELRLDSAESTSRELGNG
ncbi:VOC family protein [Cyanobium sp. LEGE 06143]|uniref:VOC family protein n=1 Tax=Cyanobium sp. LEGE 06143 TaxID=945727 RepID=UPI001880BBAC|nr:VOC family protein [Cyanobium sp. LEGE 06143]